MKPTRKVNMLNHIAILFVVVLNTAMGTYMEGSVFITSPGSASFKPGKMDKSAAAYGYYNDTLMSTGWGVLEVKAGYGKLTKNTDIMFAAGYLECAFTAEKMWNHYQNMKSFFLPAPSSKAETLVRKFFQQQDTWQRIMIQKHSESDPFWRHVSYIVAHFHGLYAGYSSVAKDHKDWAQDLFVVQMLNSVGDLIDLTRALSPDSEKDYSTMSGQNLLNLIKLQGHCSALVKTTGAFEDVFMSHSSWFVYAATNRIYKHYNFNVNDPGTAAKRMSFSSYPGFLESLDDFYLLGSDMVMLQTTNNVFNTSLYEYVGPQSLLAWQRVRLANMMANSGKEWADVLTKYNSGTYNNQYMVIDLKKIELGQSIQDDALWVVEQIPGYVEAGDQTDILRAGYWPSYNVPFYEKVYNMSGYPDFVAAHGLDYSYQLAPRAKIFRRDQTKVHNLETMKGIMRYNDFEHDPYSDGNACSTICCRGDLLNPGAKPDGCYDTKVTNFAMAKKFQAVVINGPTLGTGLKAFSWTGQFPQMKHVGLPDTYDFGWYLMEPIL